MTYLLTDEIEREMLNKGYQVDVNGSDSSDYISLTKEGDKYGLRFVVRVSNHDAMTGRSKCADLSYVPHELKDEWAGKWDAKIDVDEDGDVEYEEVTFDTEEQADAHILKCVLIEIENKINF